MAFVPNVSDAAFPHQARPLSSDLEVLRMSAGGFNGVISGCAVTESGSPGMSVDVASGVVKIAGESVSVTGDTLIIADADVSSPRWDLVVVDDTGTLDVVAGTAATSPVTEDIPADSVVLAAVYIPANDTSVTDSQIVDKRVTVQAPLGTTQWTTVSASSDLTRSNTATLAADSVLAFTMAANTKYRVRVVAIISALAASDLKYGWDGPASPTLVLGRRANVGTGGATESVAAFSAYNTSGVAVLSGDQSVIIRLDLIIHNGSNAGDFSFTWAQNSAVAENTIRRAGSYLEHEVA